MSATDVYKRQDSNSILSDFSFKTTSGISVLKSGNKLTLTSTSPVNNAVTFNSAKSMPVSYTHLRQAKYPAAYICPWRTWITQRIPIPENGGSSPFGQAKKGHPTGFPFFGLFRIRRDLKPTVKKMPPVSYTHL